LKPSAALWTFGLIILISQTFFQHNLLRSALGEKFVLPDKVWQRMNSVWVTYFGVMGLLNLWVAYSFSTDAWANFHTFGSFGLSIIFILGQGVYLNYHQSREGLDKPIP
jgi:intracellular septation protein